MNELSFRLASEEDVEAVVALQAHFYEEEGYPHDREAATRAVRELVANREYGALWLLCDGAAIAGYLSLTFGYSLEFHGRDAFVDEVFIVPAHRGRGAGTHALVVAEETCRERGIGALHLEVEPEKARTIELYARTGYAFHKRHLMTKRL